MYFGINIEEKNSDSYLSAGEMPLPALYQMLTILFFLSSCFWVFILKKNGTEQVFQIHWIRAALVFLKSLSLFFHGVNYTKIAANGIHEESWAILYYVTHLLKAGGSLQPERLPVYFGINIEEKNSDSYLSAGEMPLPALYQMLAILFFLSGCFW